MQTAEHKCDRCGLAASDTPEGVLAFNGSRRVCADCDADLTNEWVAEEPGRIHPLNALLYA